MTSPPNLPRAVLGLAVLALAIGGLVLFLQDDERATEEPPREAAPPEVADRAKPASEEAPPPRGRFVKPRQDPDRAALTDEQLEDLESIEAIGYSDGVHEAPELSGVTRHLADKTSGGINLFTSAHAATCQLIDMEGEVLHEWRKPFREVWPDYPRQDFLSTFWRRNWLYPNGDLLAIYEGIGIIKVDKDSKLLWQNQNRAHHDLQVTEDGSIWVLTRTPGLIPRIHEEKLVLEDFVSKLSPDGEEVWNLSLVEALERSDFQHLWDRTRNWDGDLLHTNSLEVLDGSIADRNPAFAEGNLLVSMLLPDLVGVVDPEQRKFVWVKRGPYHYQHDPQVLANGNVLVFDNQGAGNERSRILEMDPVTWEPIWTYEGNERQPFYSETCGLAQRLPDGNTLITESDYGRAFEVTPEGGIVWEFYNPHRAGEEGQFIATMMEMYRLPTDFPLDWLE